MVDLNIRMRFNRRRLLSIINVFLSRLITSLSHDFRDWLQDRMIKWNVLIGWHHFESCEVRFEVKAWLWAWLLSSSICFSLSLCIAIRHGTGQHFCSPARPELTWHFLDRPVLPNYNIFSGPDRPVAHNIKYAISFLPPRWWKNSQDGGKIDTWHKFASGPSLINFENLFARCL